MVLNKGGKMDMDRKIAFIVITLIFGLTTAGVGFAQETEARPPETSATQTEEAVAPERIIKGTIEEIAEDGSYLLVSGTKILTTKLLLEDYYLALGDPIEVIVEDTPEGIKAKTFRYVFEEEPPSAYEEEPAPLEEEPPSAYEEEPAPLEEGPAPSEENLIEDYEVDSPSQGN